MASRIETWSVKAFNTAKQSENKMHDDTVAQRFGFSGAFGDPVVRRIHRGTCRDALDQRILRDTNKIARNDADRQTVAAGDAIDLLLHRAGVGVDIDAGCGHG